jgi:acetyltransferase EpsM
MKKVIIIGSGGHAAELRDYINHYNGAGPTDRIEVLGFLDDNPNSHKHYSFKEPYLGKIDDHTIERHISYLIGIANLEFRSSIIKKFLSKGATFTGFIHPTAIISPSCVIEEGTVISHNVSVGAMAKVGKFNILNSRCTIGHDSSIGDCNFISPQVAISGNTKIGNGNLLGTNACTIPGITIGNGNKIAAGMVVYKNVNDNETVFFRYKERIVIREA